MSNRVTYQKWFKSILIICGRNRRIEKFNVTTTSIAFVTIWAYVIVYFSKTWDLLHCILMICFITVRALHYFSTFFKPLQISVCIICQHLYDTSCLGFVYFSMDEIAFWIFLYNLQIVVNVFETKKRPHSSRFVKLFGLNFGQSIRFRWCASI